MRRIKNETNFVVSHVEFVGLAEEWVALEIVVVVWVVFVSEVEWIVAVAFEY